MVSAILGLWPLFVGLSLIFLGVGLQGTLIGLRATAEGFDTTVTGVVMSAYYAGFLAGSWLTPRLVRVVGHIRVFAAFASLVSTTSLLHALLVDPLPWFALRFVAGLCMAGVYIIAESWLNHGSSNKTRGQILSIYSIIAFAFFGLGQLLLITGDPSGFTLFILISVLLSLSMIPISLTPQNAPPIDQPRYVGMRDLYRASPLGFVGCFATGVAQGAFFSLAAVYAALNGLSLSATALFLALPVLGVVFLQFPIGWLSDQYDRRRVLMMVTMVVGIIAIINGQLAGYPVSWQIVGITAFGAISLPLYSLSIAHMNDNIEYDQMLDASSKLVLLFGLGSLTGPLATGAIMEQLGPSSFFWVLAAAHLALGVFALYRMTRSVPVPLDDQGDFVLVPQRATTVSTGVAMELSDEGISSSNTKNSIKPEGGGQA